MSDRTTPYNAFNFTVQFLGEDISGGFSDVSGLGMELTMAEYRNGKDKGNYVRKVPNVYKVSDVTLKRGIINSQDFWDWLKEVRTKGWSAHRDVVITLMDETNEQPIQKWTLQKAYPTKYTGPTLAAKGGTDVAMEELVLTAENIDFLQVA